MGLADVVEEVVADVVVVVAAALVPKNINISP